MANKTTKNTLREAIRKVDPTATVSGGFEWEGYRHYCVLTDCRDALSKAGVAGEFIDVVGSRWNSRFQFNVTVPVA